MDRPDLSISNFENFHWSYTAIHLQFWAYGSWDSLFPISMSPNCKLMSPEHYFNDVCNTIASWDSLN